MCRLVSFTTKLTNRHIRLIWIVLKFHFKRYFGTCINPIKQTFTLIHVIPGVAKPLFDDCYVLGVSRLKFKTECAAVYV